jgi:hypothetical protein
MELVVVALVGQNAENEAAVEEVAVPADNPVVVVVVVVAAGQPEVEGQNSVLSSDRDSLDYYTSLKHKPDFQI